MSSINSVSNPYSQIYATQSTQTNATQGKHHHHHQKSSSDLAVSDQVSISSDGMAALQKDRSESRRVNPLDSLVENGTITKDQKDAIDAAFKAAHDSEKVAESGVTSADPLASLVTDGTLTTDQQSAIKDAFKAARGACRPDGPPPGGRPPGPPPSDGASSKQIDSVLSSLVSDGTLTTNQKSAVQKTLQSMMDALTETSESDDDSDDATSTSNTTSSKSKFESILADLVLKGSLTEEQKKTVTETLQAYNPYNVSK